MTIEERDVKEHVPFSGRGCFFISTVCIFVLVNISEGRQEGVHHLLNVSEIIFEGEKFQCVDFLLSV